MAQKKKDMKKEKRINTVEVVKPISVKKGQAPLINKATDLFMKHFKSIRALVIGLIIGISIMFISGYGNIAKTTDGDDLLVSIKGLDITANNLYSDLKDKYGLASILTKIDEYILKDKYSDKKADAISYADKYIESLKSQYADNWAEFLSYYGFTTDEELKASLISQYYSDLTTEEYVKTLITDDQINNYYKSSIVGDIKVSHILIKADYATDATEEEITKAKEKALKTAKSIVTKLDASEKPLELFVTLAKQYSDDTSNASKGGDLGYFNKGAMEVAFETASYNLKTVGQYTTTPVETSYGYHIIIKTAKTKAKASLKDSTDKITSALVEQKTKDDVSLPLKALMNLREEYKLNFEEPKMKTAYNELMTNKINEVINNAAAENASN